MCGVCVEVVVCVWCVLLWRGLCVCVGGGGGWGGGGGRVVVVCVVCVWRWRRRWWRRVRVEVEVEVCVCGGWRWVAGLDPALLTSPAVARAAPPHPPTLRPARRPQA